MKDAKPMHRVPSGPKEADTDSEVEIHVTVNKKTVAKLLRDTGNEDPNELSCKAMLAEWMKCQRRYKAYILQKGKNIVSFALLLLTDGDPRGMFQKMYYLHLYYTHKKFRGKGYIRRLMKYMIEREELVVYASNDTEFNVLQGCGFYYMGEVDKKSEMRASDVYIKRIAAEIDKMAAKDDEALRKQCVDKCPECGGEIDNLAIYREAEKSDSSVKGPECGGEIDNLAIYREAEKSDSSVKGPECGGEIDNLAIYREAEKSDSSVKGPCTCNNGGSS